MMEYKDDFQYSSPDNHFESYYEFVENSPLKEYLQKRIFKLTTPTTIPDLLHHFKSIIEEDNLADPVDRTIIVPNGELSRALGGRIGFQISHSSMIIKQQLEKVLVPVGTQSWICVV